MNDERIGRNYAEALLTLARKDGEQEEWGALMDAISVGMREDQTLKTFLESPKLSSARKVEILEKAMGRLETLVVNRFMEASGVKPLHRAEIVQRRPGVCRLHDSNGCKASAQG